MTQNAGNRKSWSGMYTLFTYEQLDVAFLKHGYCKGNNSWAAERRADAAIIEGLNFKSLISANEIKILWAKAEEKCPINVDFFFLCPFFFWVFTILSFEYDLSSSSFNSLLQWRVSKFEQRNEIGYERKGSDWAHSPF